MEKLTYALQKNAAMTEPVMLVVHLQKLYQLLHSCRKSKSPTTEPNSFLYVRYSQTLQPEKRISSIMYIPSKSWKPSMHKY